MTTALVRQKLYEYIRVADEKKVKAIYTMVEDQMDSYDWARDEKLFAELEKRSKEYKNGKVKGIRWEDANPSIPASNK